MLVPMKSYMAKSQTVSSFLADPDNDQELATFMQAVLYPGQSIWIPYGFNPIIIAVTTEGSDEKYVCGLVRLALQKDVDVQVLTNDLVLEVNSSITKSLNRNALPWKGGYVQTIDAWKKHIDHIRKPSNANEKNESQSGVVE